MMTGDHKKGVKIYRDILKEDNNYAPAYAGLAVYHDLSLRNPSAALKNYRKSLKIDPKQGDLWYYYANLLHYRVKDFAAAEDAYQKSLGKSDPAYISYIDYITLLRDQMAKVEEAEQIFNQHEDVINSDPINYWLQKALFSIHRKNMGDSARHWNSVFSVIDLEKDHDELEILWRSAATSYKLGFGKELLMVFETSDASRVLRPLYEALKTLVVGSEDYLTNVAPEISETALKIYRDMNDYLYSIGQ